MVLTIIQIGAIIRIPTRRSVPAKSPVFSKFISSSSFLVKKESSLSVMDEVSPVGTRRLLLKFSDESI